MGAFASLQRSFQKPAPAPPSAQSAQTLHASAMKGAGQARASTRLATTLASALPSWASARKAKKPVYTPGKKCPSCWPKENKACDCFAAIGFCEPPTKLPEKSACDTLCPGCTEPTCKCPSDACWPGKALNETRDHTCECFAELGFCKEGEKPVYTPGKKCPTCWPKENKACMCFAALGFCDAPKQSTGVLV